MFNLDEFIKGLKKDRLNTTLSIFPEIEVDKIAKDLSLEKKGRDRGIKNLPEPNSNPFDVVEYEIINEMNRVRIIGLTRYNENKEVYARRIRESKGNISQLKTLAEKALTDYQKSIVDYYSHLSNYRTHVMERYRERYTFIIDNNLRRTPYDHNGFFLSSALALILIVLESGMNGYFFSTTNTLGLLGGATFALLISLVNVGMSLALGWFARNCNHIKIPRKILGYATVITFIFILIIFNLGVAHFRDAASTLPWNEAVTKAIVTFKTDILDITNAESWLLLMVGCLFGFLAFWKGYASDDPYPDYRRVNDRWERARDEYTQETAEARQNLENLRDETIVKLETSGDILTANINEAMEIVFAESSLSSQVGYFMNTVDISVNYLLSIYRDANLVTRTDKAPEYFRDKYDFSNNALQDICPTTPEREAVKKEIESIDDLVKSTVEKIFNEYRSGIIRYQSIEELESYATVFPAPILLFNRSTNPQGIYMGESSEA